MKTSKEKMSAYLERLQRWQRITLGLEEIAFDINILAPTENGFLSITAWVNHYENYRLAEQVNFTVSEWRSEEENERQLKDCFRKLVELGVLE